MQSVVLPAAQPSMFLQCVSPDHTCLRHTGNERVRNSHMGGGNGSCLAWWLPYQAIGQPSRSPTPVRDWGQGRATAGSRPAGKQPGQCLGHVAAGWREQHCTALRSCGSRNLSPALAVWLPCGCPRSVVPRAPTRSLPNLPTPVQGLACRRPVDARPAAGQKV